MLNDAQLTFAQYQRRNMLAKSRHDETTFTGGFPLIAGVATLFLVM